MASDQSPRISALDIIARCEDYALSSAVTMSDRKAAFADAANRLRAQQAEIDQLRGIVNALRPIAQEWWRADHANLNRRAEAAAWRLAIEAHTLIPTAGDRDAE